VHQILQFGLRSSVAGGVFTAAILPYGYVSLMTVLW
jgi:Flp pilus assembly protein protease CpaA